MMVQCITKHDIGRKKVIIRKKRKSSKCVGQSTRSSVALSDRSIEPISGQEEDEEEKRMRRKSFPLIS